MFINAQAGPTKDVKVRQAIAHAIDKQGLIEALLSGYGKPVELDRGRADLRLQPTGSRAMPTIPAQGQGAGEGSRRGGRRARLPDLAGLRPARSSRRSSRCSTMSA